MQNRNISIEISPGTIFFVLFIVVFAWFLYEIREIIPIVLSAVIFSLALIPGKTFLTRFHIPAPIAVILLYIFMFLLLSVFLYALLPIIAQQYTVFVESLPNLIIIVQDFLADTWLAPLTVEYFERYSVSNTQGVADAVQSFFTSAGKGILSIFGGIVDIILFLILTFLFTVRPAILENTVSVLAPAKYRRYVEDLWVRTKKKTGQWFQGQVLLVFVIGALTYLPLLLLDVPNAFLLATFAGVMELIPIFGPVLGAIPAVLMALTTGDLTTVILVTLVFFVVQQLENHLIYPLVVSKVVGISPVLIILAIVIGVILAGFVGVVIAVPLAGVLQEFLNDVHSGNIMRFVEQEATEAPTNDTVA